jgi:hypothetical protein
VTGKIVLSLDFGYNARLWLKKGMIVMHKPIGISLKLIAVGGYVVPLPTNTQAQTTTTKKTAPSKLAACATASQGA